MGLFTPKISAFQATQVEILLEQANESASVLNRTSNPEAFFGRLGFLLDVLLELQKYEKYKVFRGSSPTKDYKKVLNNMEKTVDDFIDRAIEANELKINSLKTIAAKERNRKKFVISLAVAFEKSNSFWQGNGMYPHYTGALFTENNYLRVQSMLEE